MSPLGLLFGQGQAAVSNGAGISHANLSPSRCR
jgi:hypothetical protein